MIYRCRYTMFHDDALAQPMLGMVVHIAWLANRQSGKDHVTDVILNNNGCVYQPVVNHSFETISN